MAVPVLLARVGPVLQQQLNYLVLALQGESGRFFSPFIYKDSSSDYLIHKFSGSVIAIRQRENRTDT